MAKYKQPCFDSSVFLGKLKEEICRTIKRAVVFDWVWQRAKAGEFEVVISSLTLAEVYKTKRRIDGQVEATELETEHCDEFLELINEPFVKVIELDRETGLLAHALCRKYNLWPGDGIQLASAIKAGCDVLIAWDRPLVGKTHDSCRIEEPTIYQRDLFNRGIEIASAEEIAEYEKKHIKAAVETAVAVAADVSGGGNGSPEGEAAAAPREAVKAVALPLDEEEVPPE